jgi:hypothetical protein
MIGANTVETDCFDLLLKSAAVALLRRRRREPQYG